jgi:hypothetical protein
MKYLALALLLTGCASDLGTVSYSRRVGDGKATVTASQNSVFFGYSRALPVPPAKGVVPVEKPAVGWLDQVKSWF